VKASARQWLDRHLTGDNGRSALMAIVDNFEEITTLLAGKRGETPVVEDGPPKLANVFRSTRNSDCPRRYTSLASGMDSAIRRKSSGVMALTYRLGIRRAITRTVRPPQFKATL
jgi:hypothetical protein